MLKLKISMVVLNNVLYDSRVKRMAKTMKTEKHDVSIIGLFNSAEKIPLEIEEVPIKAVLVNTEKYPRWLVFKIYKYVKIFILLFYVAYYENSEVYHLHDLNSLVPGFIAAKLRRAKIIFDAHELYRERYHSGRLSHFLQKILLPFVNSCITVSTSIKKYMELHYKVKVHVIRNIPNGMTFSKKGDPLVEHLKLEQDSKIVLYQGTIISYRGLEETIKAFNLIKDQNIYFIILGYFNDSRYENTLKHLIEEHGLKKRILFHPAVNYKDLLNYTKSADLGLSLIQKCDLSYYYSLPNKVFEYVLAQVPLLVSHFPDMGELIDSYKIGWTVNPADPQEIAEKIVDIFEPRNIHKYNEVKNNLKKAKKELVWEKEQLKLLELYENLS